MIRAPATSPKTAPAPDGRHGRRPMPAAPGSGEPGRCAPAAQGRAGGDGIGSARSPPFLARFRKRRRGSGPPDGENRHPGSAAMRAYARQRAPPAVAPRPKRRRCGTPGVGPPAPEVAARRWTGAHGGGAPNCAWPNCAWLIDRRTLAHPPPPAGDSRRTRPETAPPSPARAWLKHTGLGTPTLDIFMSTQRFTARAVRRPRPGGLPQRLHSPAPPGSFCRRRLSSAKTAGQNKPNS